MRPTTFRMPDGSALVGPSIAEIDERSKKLIDEFAEHADEIHALLYAENPQALEPGGGIDKRRAFEGWAVQKLSSLQLYVEFYERAFLRVAQELAELRRELKK